jgi:Glycosyl hydrolases family 17
MGNNLPSPRDVVELYKRNGIGAMRIYDPQQDTLEALRGTNIHLIMDAPDVRALANGSNAIDWVRKNILPYKDVSFRYCYHCYCNSSTFSIGRSFHTLSLSVKVYTSFIIQLLSE